MLSGTPGSGTAASTTAASSTVCTINPSPSAALHFQPGVGSAHVLTSPSGPPLQKLGLVVCSVALIAGLASRCWLFHWRSAQLGDRLFALYDQNRDALLSAVELVKYLSDHGVNISSRQASSWLAGVDDENDGFDIGETQTVMRIFDDFPTASLALQHVAQDVSVFWDLVLLFPLAAVLAFLIWHTGPAGVGHTTVAVTLPLAPGLAQQSVRLPRCPSPPISQRSPSAASVPPRCTPIALPRDEHSSDVPTHQSSDDIAIHDDATGVSPIASGPAGVAAEPSQDAQRELRRWRSTAERYMGEASALSTRLVNLKSCLQMAGALRGASRGLFTDQGAQEGFCAPRREAILTTLTFGTLDLSDLYEMELSEQKGTLAEGCEGFYICRHVMTGQRFFAKMYDIIGQDREQEICNEIRAQTWLPAHDNIARPVSVIEVEDRVFVIFELVHGQDLVSAIDERGFSLTEDEARRIFLHVCQALIALHASAVNVIHGSMKPENIVVDGGATRLHSHNVMVRLHDFSQASFLCVAAPGAPVPDDYLAPEDLRQDARQSKATDVWRFGATLYAALLGRLPFTHDVLVDGKWRPAVDAARLEVGQFHEPLGAWEELSAACRSLLAACLAAEPKLRPSAAEVLAHSWFSNSIQQAG